MLRSILAFGDWILRRLGCRRGVASETGEPSKHRWQHFIPRMYLRAFVDPERVKKQQHDLWVYRTARDPKPRGPRGVAAAAHFYTTEEIPDPIATEKMLAEVEGHSTPHIEKLRSGDINLTAQEKAEFATYMGLQLVRTPLARDRANALAIDLMRKAWKKTQKEGKLAAFVEELEAKTGERIGIELASFEEFVRKIADGTVQMVQESKGWNMKHMLDMAVKSGDMFQRMHWGLLEAPAGEAFITSDNPVQIADPTAKARGPKGYKSSNQTRASFPLSPRLMLYLDFAERSDERVMISAESVRSTQRIQIENAYQEIYASFRSDALNAEVQRIFETRTPPELTWKVPPDIL